MALTPLKVSGYCPFARLASPDCFFLGSGGCTFITCGKEYPLMLTEHEFKAELLADQADRLDATIDTEIRGPFNRLLTVPVAAVEHSVPKHGLLVDQLVASGSIDVSTPLHPQTMTAILGVCVAVIGTRTEKGVGIFNVILHLLPTGHLIGALESTCPGSGCSSQQFTRWAMHMFINDNNQRKHWYLASMLSVFQGGGWDLTVVTPVIGKLDTARWIDHVDVSEYLTNTLGYDKDVITQEAGGNVMVSPNGNIDIKPPNQ